VAQSLLPKKFSQWLQIKILNLAQGELPKELIPEHRILEANPTIRGDFVEKVKTGQVTVHRAGIEKITTSGLVTTTGKELELDTIISCTGYEIDWPYLPKDVYRSSTPKAPDAPDAHHTVDLYKFIHPINYENLFAIGLVEAAGAFAPIVEAQARWSVGILTKRIPLPSPTERAQAVATMHKVQAREFVQSERHATTVDFLPYIDDILTPLGANPTFGKLLGLVFTSGSPFKALSLLNAVYMLIPSPAQYRLFGHKSDTKLATATILRMTSDKSELDRVEKEILESRSGKGVNGNGNGVVV
jgi:dimethylaniline monooxygenase (N-oxide forming)